MVDDGQHHVVRIAVLETEIAHMKVQQHKGFEELKTLILEARNAYQNDKAHAGTQKWQMSLAFYVAGLGFIANALVTILKDVTQ
jgi:hypothetical protein